MMMHKCNMVGCFTMVPDRGAYCERHRYAQVERDRARAQSAGKRWDEHHDAHPEWSAIYRDPMWRKVRAQHLHAHPDCVVCGGKGTTVDHIIPHRGNEGLAFDPDNLQTLCESCHARKTRGDRG